MAANEEKKLTKEEKKQAKAEKKANKHALKEKSGSLWQEFKKFVLRGNVIDMAVGVTVGAAFSAIVTAFTKGFISPLVALITGGFSLADLKIIVRPAVTEIVDGAEKVITPEVAFAWGLFVQAIIDFLIIAGALFILLKVATTTAKKAKELRDKVTGAADRRAKEEAEAKAKEAEEKAAQELAAQQAKEKEEKEEARKQEELELLRQIASRLEGRN